MTTTHQHDPYWSASMTFALAKARTAELMAEAEQARFARAVDRRPRRGVAWPTGVVTALRDSFTSRRASGRGELCPTC